MKGIIYNLFINKKKLNKRGELLVLICAYQNGKKKYFNTQVHIRPEQWNERKKNITDPILFKKVKEKLKELEAFEEELWLKNKTFSLSDFELLNQPEAVPKSRPETFLQFFESELLLEKSKLSYVTYTQQQKCLSHFKEFGGERYKWNLTIEMVQKWDIFLREKQNGINTIAKRHQQLAKFINAAIDKDFLIKSPYKKKGISGFKIEKQKTNPDFLTVEERERIEKLTFEPTESFLEMSRDMFLFGCFTSLRISDILALSAKDFSETSEGLKLSITAVKGQKKAKKVWEYALDGFYDGKPAQIIKKYWRDDGKRFFYGQTNPKVNKSLKEIGKRAEINKSLKFHTSRHTFGSHAVQILSITDVQAIMLHDRIETTQIYTHINNRELKQRIKSAKWN